MSTVEQIDIVENSDASKIAFEFTKALKAVFKNMTGENLIVDNSQNSYTFFQEGDPYVAPSKIRLSQATFTGSYRGKDMSVRFWADLTQIAMWMFDPSDPFDEEYIFDYLCVAVDDGDMANQLLRQFGAMSLVAQGEVRAWEKAQSI